jgi:hypothetical protein
MEEAPVMQTHFIVVLRTLIAALVSLCLAGCAIHGHRHTDKPEATEEAQKSKAKKKKRKAKPRKKASQGKADNQAKEDKTPPPPPPPISY